MIPHHTSTSQSQLPDSVKRAALAALVKQRETVVVPDLSSKVALVTGGLFYMYMYLSIYIQLLNAPVSKHHVWQQKQNVCVCMCLCGWQYCAVSVPLPPITGSVGLGLQVAKALALNGARVIIAGRSETRCAECV